MNGENRPYTAFSPNWASGDFVREYMSTLESVGIGVANYGIDYSLEKFAGGKTLMALDLSPGEYRILWKYLILTSRQKNIPFYCRPTLQWRTLAHGASL